MNTIPLKKTEKDYLKLSLIDKYILDKEENIVQKQGVNYFVKISEEELQLIVDNINKLENDDVIMYLNDLPVIRTDVKLYGNANSKSLNTSKVKDFLHYRYVNNKLAFRNYNTSLDKWVKNLPFINVCEDAKTSFQSIMRSFGRRDVKGLNNSYKPFNCVIIQKTL